MIVDITKHREEFERGWICSTYMTWTAWERWVLNRSEHHALAGLFQSLKEALLESPLVTVIHIGTKSQQHELKAVFGPAGKRYGCVVLILSEEEPWVRPKFPLGDIVLSDRAEKCRSEREILNVALSRHAAGDWGEAANRSPICYLPVLLSDLPDHDKALASDERLISFYHVPSIGEEGLWLVTEPNRSRTTIWSLWDQAKPWDPGSRRSRASGSGGERSP
jgi:hypothetical protein